MPHNDAFSPAVGHPDLLTKYKLLERALRDRRLGTSVTPRAVLQCLIEHDGALGCFPGKKTIADLCGIDVSNVGAALKRLKEHGYVDWTSRPGEGKSRGSNLYHINYGLVPQSPAHPCPDREEETAIVEIAGYVRDSMPDDVVEGPNIVEAVIDRLDEMSSGKNQGRTLYLWLREAQRGRGNSLIDEVIKEKMSLQSVESKE